MVHKVKKVIKEIEENQILCDFCGKEVDYSYSGHQGCEICGRDGCHKHLHIDNNKWASDFYDAYCHPCWKIGEPFRERLEELEADYYEKRGELNSEWKRLAKENVKNSE